VLRPCDRPAPQGRSCGETGSVCGQGAAARGTQLKAKGPPHPCTNPRPPAGGPHLLLRPRRCQLRGSQLRLERLVRRPRRRRRAALLRRRRLQVSDALPLLLHNLLQAKSKDSGSQGQVKRRAAGLDAAIPCSKACPPAQPAATKQAASAADPAADLMRGPVRQRQPAGPSRSGGTAWNTAPSAEQLCSPAGRNLTSDLASVSAAPRARCAAPSAAAARASAAAASCCRCRASCCTRCNSACRWCVGRVLSG
jgi:hypothetical protein